MALKTNYIDNLGNKYDDVYININSLLVNKKIDGSGEFVADFRYFVYTDETKNKEIGGQKIFRIPIDDKKPIFTQIYDYLKAQPMFIISKDV